MVSNLEKAGVIHIGNIRIDFLGSDKEKAYVSINGKEHALKLRYRRERTWNDHMGNTPCGYYIDLPLPSGKKERAYLY